MAKFEAPWPGAVAVSGGGDSLALMHLLSAWAKARRVAQPVVVTVDHGLVKGSGAHARKVSKWATDLGLKAQVLTWKGKKPSSDIEAGAREARYRLIGEWCRKRGIATLYAGHTRDDQAETFLLRLARGSGLDGLAAMRPVAPFPVAGFQELRLVRPLIDFQREDLRKYLADIRQDWLEDPMNSDKRFDRVRIRAALRELNACGVKTSRIADAAAHLGRAREALDTVTAAVLARACHPQGEGIAVETHALLAAPREIGLRALAAILMTVSGQAYRPRFEKLERLFDSIALERLRAGRTLHGCRISPAPRSGTRSTADTVLVEREIRAPGTQI